MLWRNCFWHRGSLSQSPCKSNMDSRCPRNFNCSMPLWEYTNARMIASSKWAQIQFQVDLGFTLVASPQVESVHALTGKYACPFIWLADSKLVLENCVLLAVLPSFPAFTKLSVLKLAHCFFQLLPLHSYEQLTKWLTKLQVQRSARWRFAAVIAL